MNYCALSNGLNCEGIGSIPIFKAIGGCHYLIDNRKKKVLPKTMPMGPNFKVILSKVDKTTFKMYIDHLR